MNNQDETPTKGEKREEKEKKLKKKQVKHSYWDLGRELLIKQQETISRNMKKILKSKIKMK